MNHPEELQHMLPNLDSDDDNHTDLYSNQHHYTYISPAVFYSRHNNPINPRLNKILYVLKCLSLLLVTIILLAMILSTDSVGYNSRYTPVTCKEVNACDPIDLAKYRDGWTRFHRLTYWDRVYSTITGGQVYDDADDVNTKINPYSNTLILYLILIPVYTILFYLITVSYACYHLCKA